MGIFEERKKRTDWFLNDRFGMFIHWGLYAIPGRGEWVKSFEFIEDSEYQKYFDRFDPVNYDPKKWAKIAKDAGMKYAVLTTKHHDGFCLFDSKYTDYKATNTKAKRDLVKEYVDAFRAEGLKVGFYYSLLDWHHPDYPAYGDRQHPMRNNPAYKDIKQDFSKYVEYMYNQVEELLTNYGKIDIMWFDFSYEDENNIMRGEKWGSTKLIKMIRELQPHIIIDDRLGANIKSSDPEIFVGDFASPEQIVPAEGILAENGEKLPWEACITLNNNWGYCSSDYEYKTPQQVIHLMVDCVSKGGNLLLNVGPNAKGEIPEKTIEILAEVGKWMKANGESIYGCGTCSIPAPAWGRYTQKGDDIYAHFFSRGIGPILIEKLGGDLKFASYVSDGSEVNISKPWNAMHAEGEGAFINFPHAKLPDELDTVIKLEINKG